MQSLALDRAMAYVWCKQSSPHVLGWGGGGCGEGGEGGSTPHTEIICKGYIRGTELSTVQLVISSVIFVLIRFDIVSRATDKKHLTLKCTACSGNPAVDLFPPPPPPQFSHLSICSIHAVVSQRSPPYIYITPGCLLLFLFFSF
jgi:hypothetical protein